MRLHPVQEKLLKLLKKNASDPLSIRELQDEAEVTSPSVIQHHIKQLEKKGYLRRNPSDPRDYQILKEPDSQIAYLNLYVMAQCGPNGRLVECEPIERVPIYSPILGFSALEAFLVKARGNSMEPQIHNGDMVIAKKASVAQDNSIVVCVNKGEAFIKRIQEIPGNNLLLNSTNPKYPPFLADPETFHIEGIVKGVWKHQI